MTRAAESVFLVQLGAGTEERLAEESPQKPKSDVKAFRKAFLPAAANKKSMKLLFASEHPQ
jgi:hypothetical protein